MNLKGGDREGLAFLQAKWYKDVSTNNNALFINNFPESKKDIKINFNLTVKF